MEYGKYPLEPYGALGGLHRKNSSSIAQGLGAIAGTLIGIAVMTLFYVSRMLIVWIIRIVGNGYKNFASGIKNALRK